MIPNKMLITKNSDAILMKGEWIMVNNKRLVKWFNCKALAIKKIKRQVFVMKWI